MDYVEYLNANKEKIKSYLLENQTPIKKGGIELYPTSLGNKKIYICFEQPEQENILEFMDINEEVFFL